MTDEFGARSALDVALRILGARCRTSTSPMHVIKLTYLCHGWMLGVHGRPLIADDVIAWQYGPVVLSVYEKYKRWRGLPIEVDVDERVCEDFFDDSQNGMIKAVVHAYRNHTAFDLSYITHEPDTPWDSVYAGGSGKGLVIPNCLIRKHYQKKWDDAHGH